MQYSRRVLSNNLNKRKGEEGAKTRKMRRGGGRGRERVEETVREVGGGRFKQATRSYILHRGNWQWSQDINNISNRYNKL